MNKDMSETLIRTGPGTAMGALMRRYWVPILQSNEIPNLTGRRCGCRSWVKTCSRFAIPGVGWD